MKIKNILTQPVSSQLKSDNIPLEKWVRQTYVMYSVSEALLAAEYVKIHERSHTWEKPFDCPQYNKGLNFCINWKFVFAYRKKKLLKHLSKCHSNAIGETRGFALTTDYKNRPGTHTAELNHFL